MNRSMTASINFSIVLFLTGLSLVGMDPKYILFKQEQTIEHPYDLACIKKTLEEGIFQYDRGSKLIAEIGLFTAYSQAERKGFLHLIDETLLTRVRSMICVTQCQRTFYETALSFADDPQDQRKIYQRMAKRAYKEGNLFLGQKYIQHAFRIKKEIAEHQKEIAECEKEMTAYERKTDYEKEHVKKQRTTLEAHQSKLRYEYHISSILQIDPMDLDFPCILSAMSLNNNQENFSYIQSLEYAKKAIINLTRTPIDTAISFRYIMHFPTILKRLCNEPADPIIQSNAAMLQKYYDMLFAIKMKNQARSQELSTIYKAENTMQAIPLQLLSSAIDMPRLCTLIQSLTFDNPEFIAFCTSAERELAIPILKWALDNLELTQKEKDFYHIFLGGYEYHRKRYDDAITHFKNCSHYNKDIYLQALSLKASRLENYYEEMASILPLLRKSLTIHEKSSKIKQAHRIIANICEYDLSLPIQEIVSTCEKLVLHALSSHNEDPFAHGYMLFACADMNKKNYALSAEQEKIKTLTSYFTFFEALQSNNQKKLDHFFSAKENNLNSIRSILLRSFRSKNKNGIKEIIFEDTSFQEFCLSDGFIIKPILKHILDHPNMLYKIKREDCHYILGGIASAQDNYTTALKRFSKCNRSDLYILAKLIEATNVKDVLTPLKAYVSLLKTKISITNSTHKKDAAALDLIKKIINNISITMYVSNAIKNSKYENAYDFIDCLMQLDMPEVYSSLCHEFIITEQSIINLPALEYHALFTMPNRINMYNSILRHAHKKQHNALFCHSLAGMLLEHSEQKSHTGENSLALKRECLRYLSCSLKHEVGTTDEVHHKKRDTCGHLAHFFGTNDDSFDLLDLAIKCGNHSALRTKALLLARKNNIKNADEIVKLLEQHAKSEDEPADRALSYSELGTIIYSNEKQWNPKDQNVAFDCFKAAADLGNYESTHLLADLYFKRVEGYQGVDAEKMLWYLEKNMELNKKESYGEALYLHAAICYKEKQYQRTEADLEKLLALTNYSDLQKILPYWLMGLTKLQLLDEQSNLSEEAVSHLQKAYTLSCIQVANTKTSLIEDLTLCDNKEAMFMIEEKLNHILHYKKNDMLSLRFCNTIGCILFNQCLTKPIKDKYRKYALSALLHSAENKFIDAAVWLVHATEDEVKRCNKIYYLEALPKNNLLSADIDAILKDLHPKEIIGQAELICFFAHKNNDTVLNNYIAHLYENYVPHVAHLTNYEACFYARDSIQKCLQMPIVKESADAFLKNPMNSTPIEHFAAIFLGSLLTYSFDDKELIKGACYLEASRKNFPIIQTEHIEKNLGYLYYRLGKQTLENGRNILAMGYFKKGAELKNQDCALVLTQSAPKNEIKQRTLVPSIEKAFERLTKEIDEKELNKFARETTLHEKHPAYNFLVSATTNAITEKDISQCIAVVNLIHSYEKTIECNEPILCMQYAQTIYNSLQNNNNLNLIAQLIRKALSLGTINDTSRENALFINDTILLNICELIATIIHKNNTKHTAYLLPTIKKGLIEHTIDIKAFEHFYHSFYKMKLAHNNVWKKVK